MRFASEEQVSKIRAALAAPLTRSSAGASIALRALRLQAIEPPRDGDRATVREALRA